MRLLEVHRGSPAPKRTQGFPLRQEADKKAKAVTGVAASGKKRAKGSFGVGSAIFGLDGALAPFRIGRRMWQGLFLFL